MHRRHDRLVDAAKEASPGTLAVRCDVTDEESCRSAIEEAAAGLGGIDGLIYATGIGPLARLVDISAETWRQTFDTNVTGAALVTAAAIPHLTASGGVAAYLSSVAASLTPPWPGLGAYAVSKAALDTLVEAWRQEHPGVGFTRIVVGDCAGGEGGSATEFANEWNWSSPPSCTRYGAPAITERRAARGGRLVRVVELVLRCGATACIPTVAVTPRRPA